MATKGPSEVYFIKTTVQLVALDTSTSWHRSSSAAIVALTCTLSSLRILHLLNLNDIIGSGCNFSVLPALCCNLVPHDSWSMITRQIIRGVWLVHYQTSLRFRGTLICLQSRFKSFSLHSKYVTHLDNASQAQQGVRKVTPEFPSVHLSSENTPTSS